jgi:hypothetical protein
MLNGAHQPNKDEQHHDHIVILAGNRREDKCPAYERADRIKPAPFIRSPGCVAKLLRQSRTEYQASSETTERQSRTR